MYLKKISLYNFRNYKDLDIKFCHNWNILIGNNGIGKTNILEAIYYSSTTKSPRTNNLVDLVNLDSLEKIFSLNIDFIQENTLKEQVQKIKHKYVYTKQK